MTAPLSGVVVVELGRFITGPFASQLLADLGARVIKVESPDDGDPFRKWGRDLYSPYFQAYNRSKQSVAVDLGTDAGRAVVRRLCESADVLIENFRPGVADALHLGFKDLSAVNPRLVYCAITGFGDDGPYASRPGFDTVGQALSGLLATTIDVTADDIEPPPLVGQPVSDALTGIYAAYGILGALVSRGSTGRGQRVATSLLEASAGFLLPSFATLFSVGEAPSPSLRARSSLAYVFSCADGLLLAVHLSSVFWQRLTSALAAPELHADPRFVSYADRVTNYDELRSLLAPLFAQRTRAELMTLLERADVPFAPVLGLHEVVEDRQVQHLGLVQETAHPTHGNLRFIGCPVRYSDTEPPRATAPPVLGQDTETVLAEFGFGADEIAALRRNGVVA